MKGKYFPKQIWAMTAMDTCLEGQVPRLEKLLPSDIKEASKVRCELAKAMLQDVVKALSGSKNIENRILIVSPDERVREIAEGQGVSFHLLRKKEEGLNAALSEGSQWVDKKGGDALLFVAPDLPLAKTEAIDRLIDNDDGNAERIIILGPSRGGGTVIIYRRPITFDFTPLYSYPTIRSQTFLRHCIQAKKALNGHGPLVIFDSFYLSTDMDIEEDLIDLEFHGRETESWKVIGPWLTYNATNNRDYFEREK